MRKLLTTFVLGGLLAAGCSHEAAQNRSNSGKPQGDRVPNVGNPDAQAPTNSSATPGQPGPPGTRTDQPGSGGKGGAP